MITADPDCRCQACLDAEVGTRIDRLITERDEAREAAIDLRGESDRLRAALEDIGDRVTGAPSLPSSSVGWILARVALALEADE